jgi:hypothetical protein
MPTNPSPFSSAARAAQSRASSPLSTSSSSSSSSTPSRTALPIQFTQLTDEDLKSPATLNVLLSQVFTQLNSLIGAAGPTPLASGANVYGATITGLGNPQTSSDAVSQSHVATNYGPGAQQPALDIGGSNALKGLTASYALASQAQTTLQGITASTASTGSQLLPSGEILKWGTSGSITTTGTVTFPTPFPTACLIAIVCDSTSNGSRLIWASGGFSPTGFTASNNGTGVANWWAIGN